MPSLKRMATRSLAYIISLLIMLPNVRYDPWRTMVLILSALVTAILWYVMARFSCMGIFRLYRGIKARIGRCGAYSLAPLTVSNTRAVFKRSIQAFLFAFTIIIIVGREFGELELGSFNEASITLISLSSIAFIALPFLTFLLPSMWSITDVGLREVDQQEMLATNPGQEILSYTRILTGLGAIVSLALLFVPLFNNLGYLFGLGTGFGLIATANYAPTLLATLLYRDLLHKRLVRRFRTILEAEGVTKLKEIVLEQHSIRELVDEEVGEQSTYKDEPAKLA